MMIHRKNKHPEKVRACKDQSGCQFKPCWFKHMDEITNNSSNKENLEQSNNEVSSNETEKEQNFFKSPLKKTPPLNQSYQNTVKN